MPIAPMLASWFFGAAYFTVATQFGMWMRFH